MARTLESGNLGIGNSKKLAGCRRYELRKSEERFLAWLEMTDGCGGSSGQYAQLCAGLHTANCSLTGSRRR